ncbi:MAG: 50S ribosomal protein L17 [Flavobacteriaceae bacterium]|nr:50S ribosomal protein L17 [Flavobacteriaceae bacterium]|tara:strand:+ start:3767 stop:4381 length:615 start_codon:yes stop_codon:yes gene_type:complete
MKHGKKVNHLGRKVAHRKSMLANMASSLIEHKLINTTLAKAKALRQFLEPLITKSKVDSTQNRRLVFSALRNKYAVATLFREIAPKVGDRPGGYTRVIKMGNRLGDNADMAMIELVDFNEVYNIEKSEAKKTTRRSRSIKKSTPAETVAPETENLSDTSELADDNAPKNVTEETDTVTQEAFEQNSQETKDDDAATESQNKEDA